MRRLVTAMREFTGASAGVAVKADADAAMARTHPRIIFSRNLIFPFWMSLFFLFFFKKLAPTVLTNDSLSAGGGEAETTLAGRGCAIWGGE